MLFGAGKKFVRFATVLESERFKLVVAETDSVRQPFLDKHRTGVRADCLYQLSYPNRRHPGRRVFEAVHRRPRETGSFKPRTHVRPRWTQCAG
jgi:hypothetical protein